MDYETVLAYTGGDNRKGRRGYSEFIQWGIERGIENPLSLGKGNGIVGQTDFVQWVKETFLNKEVSDREQPELRELKKAFQPLGLIDQFAHLTGKSKEEICQRGKHSIERSMLMEFLYRFCKIDQSEIGGLVSGVDYSAVSQARKRLRLRLSRDPKLKRKFDQLDGHLAKMSRIKI